MQHLCSLAPIITPLSTRGCLLFNPIKTGKNSTANNYLTSGFYGIIIRTTPRRSSDDYQWRISSMERESTYEVDSAKAKQALSELDQQFESLSVKQVSSSKIKGSSVGRSMKEEVKNEPPEITGTFLGYTAFVLFVFSIFYNVLFITVIKPSIDGPDEDIVATEVTTAYQASDASQ